MPNPLTPNYVPGVGQLVTYRSDFESHVTGTGFRHTADQIDLTAPLIINGSSPTTVTTVEQALVTLNANFLPAPSPATFSTLGTITLAGDLNGVGSTALVPQVGGLQGIPVSNNVPTNNQYLQFLTSSGKWTPSSLTFSGDVTGTPGATVISSISASGPAVPIGTNMNLTSSNIITLLSGSTLTANSGSTVNLNSTNTNFNSASINFSATSALNFTTGSTFNGTMRIANNSTMSFDSISQLDFNGSNFINIGGSAAINNLGNTINVNWPTWQTPINRSLIQPVAEGQPLGGTFFILVQGVSDNAAGGSWVTTISRLQNGGTLSSIVMSWSVGLSHSNVPSVLPNLSVVRYTYGNEFAPVTLSSTDPQFLPAPGSAAAYYNSGHVKTLTYTCNQHNVIDNTQYYYVVIITDESGSNSLAQNNFFSLQCNYTNIPDQSWNI